MKMTAKKRETIIIAILWIMASLVMIKSILTDFGFDNSYQIAMSYRHICGDRMFLDMWEPHQTSGFFMDLLLLFYSVCSRLYRDRTVYADCRNCSGYGDCFGDV